MYKRQEWGRYKVNVNCVAFGLIRTRLTQATAAQGAAIDVAGQRIEVGVNPGLLQALEQMVPLELEVGVLSSSSRRYLDLVTKLDQLMPLLQTLEIHEVITPQAVDIERAAFKRKVRDVANGARNLATRLRREMNAMDARRAENAPIAGDEAGVAATSEEAAEGSAAAAEVLPAPDDVQAVVMAEGDAGTVDGLV